MSRIKFQSFSSGSCGNAYILGICPDEGDRIETGILIDAGVSLRRVRTELERHGNALPALDSILISHDHWDHIRSIGTYCKKLHLPILCSPTLATALIRHPGTGEYLKGNLRHLSEGWNEVATGRISVKYFVVPHDATETVGYAILADGHRYVHITDCGRMTEEALNWCRQAETVVIESNYDPHMLSTGPYPPELQDRIRDGHGHMSNAECAAAIRDFLHPGLRNIFLCHLSEHNNTPELALSEARAAVRDFEDPVRVVALPRESASPLFTL